MALSALLGLKNSKVFVRKNFFGSTKLRQRSRRGCLLVALQANAISPSRLFPVIVICWSKSFGWSVSKQCV